MKQVNRVTHSSYGGNPANREQMIDQATAKSGAVEEKNPSRENPMSENMRMKDDK